ncbi:hypothetical protein F4859DRAFT_482890 [Xylaria cf. heliscus]|nr:hypothetical protein F4859DRAFT_482890 [Xylaria cf. heliscus]
MSLYPIVYISGVPLYNVWFGHRLNGDDLEVNRARRTRALESIASAMVQLGSFSFRTSGSPILQAMGPRQAPARHDMSTRKPCLIDGSFIKIHPTTLYTRAMKVPAVRGLTIPSWSTYIPRKSRFRKVSLHSHPDFDIQNFIVSEDGDLQGIIDWDGVAAVPRTIGNARYPGWLTRDWDPVMYGYRESMGQGIERDGVWEDSPLCLANYRQVYKGVIAKCQRDDNSVDLCRMSLITDNLSIAAEDPRCRSAILRKVTQNIWNRAGQGSELDFVELVTTFAENKVDVSVMNALQIGFNALLVEGGL